MKLNVMCWAAAAALASALMASPVWAQDQAAPPLVEQINGGNWPAYDEDAGFRDVRLTLGLLVPVTEHWLVGAGVMFMRLIDNAADSPIVDDAGSPNQIRGGLGVAYAW
jgi:MltA-interacting protein MipA